MLFLWIIHTHIPTQCHKHTQTDTYPSFLSYKIEIKNSKQINVSIRKHKAGYSCGT